MTSLEDKNPVLEAQPPAHLDPLPFSDFPEDVQVCILSFLKPSDVSIFACASKRYMRLCRCDSRLWYAMCDRRWGSVTGVRKWGGGKIPYRILYKILDEWDNLIGFWRRSGLGRPVGGAVLPPLVLFEWGPSFIAGYRVSPSKSGMYEVIKAPFLWMGLSAQGEIVNFLHPGCRIDLSADLLVSYHLGFSGSDLVPVNVNFMNESHVVVEENQGSGCSFSSPPRKIGPRLGEDGSVSQDGSPQSFPDRLMSEIYQYFANRTSPGGERRQRKREKEMQGRRKWEPEHFVKIVNYSPTSSRPLQGLWKGTFDGHSPDFYLVAYDDSGGITCHRVGDLSWMPSSVNSSASMASSPRPEEGFHESVTYLQPHGMLGGFPAGPLG